MKRSPDEFGPVGHVSAEERLNARRVMSDMTRLAVELRANGLLEPLHPSELGKRVVELEASGMRIGEIAIELHRSPSHVANCGRLWRELPSEIREAWRARDRLATLPRLLELVVQSHADALATWRRIKEDDACEDDAPSRVIRTRGRRLRRPTQRLANRARGWVQEQPADALTASEWRELLLQTLGWFNGESPPLFGVDLTPRAGAPADEPRRKRRK